MHPKISNLIRTNLSSLVNQEIYHVTKKRKIINPIAVMEDQTPLENSQVFENIDFNSSPEDAKEQSNADDQEQVCAANLHATMMSNSRTA